MDESNEETPMQEMGWKIFDLSKVVVRLESQLTEVFKRLDVLEKPKGSEEMGQPYLSYPASAPCAQCGRVICICQTLVGKIKFTEY